MRGYLILEAQIYQIHYVTEEKLSRRYILEVSFLYLAMNCAPNSLVSLLVKWAECQAEL